MPSRIGGRSLVGGLLLFLLRLTLASKGTHFLEFGFDLLLNGNGNAREQSRVPIEFGHELAHHLADANDVTASGLDVNLLLVVEVRLKPE